MFKYSIHTGDTELKEGTIVISAEDQLGKGILKFMGMDGFMFVNT
jgi:hypothetical protein